MPGARLAHARPRRQPSAIAQTQETSRKTSGGTVVREGGRRGLVNEVVERGRALERAQERAREIAGLPQGAIRADKESVMRDVGRSVEERLRLEAEMTLSMFMRRDSHAVGAGA